MNLAPRTFKLTVVCLLCLSLFSCKKDPTVSNTDPVTNPSNGTSGGSPSSFAVPAPTPVNASVTGRIVDENDLPAPGASVTISNNVFTTDANGYFRTGMLSLDKYISTVVVTKAGYFKAWRSFSAGPGKNYFTVKLIPKGTPISFNTNTASDVTLNNGTRISFPANGIIVKATGAPYTGIVNVFSAYIDPTRTDISTVIPGGFTGSDGSKLYTLQSKGMIAVELEDGTGQSLQLAGGSPATVKLVIPVTLQATAPATIDTWSLDSRGIWVKEGTATKNGNVYELSVSHFSFWNTDIAQAAIFLTLNVKDQAQNTLASTYISLNSSTSNDYGFGVASGYTDSLGNISGLVPSGRTLVMSAFASPYLCSTPLAVQNIGPFTTNTSLSVVAAINASNILNVTGTATNCTGAAVANGTAVAYVNNNEYSAAILNGSFSIDVPHCTPISNVVVVAVDNATQQQSISQIVPVTGNTAVAGSLSACGTSTQQFIHYNLFGLNDYMLVQNSPDSIYASVETNLSGALVTRIYGLKFPDPNSYLQAEFSANGTSTGVFSCAQEVYFNNYYTLGAPDPSSIVSFSTFGNVGSFVEGSFDIIFTTLNSGVQHWTGTFRVKRSQ